LCRQERAERAWARAAGLEGQWWVVVVVMTVVVMTVMMVMMVVDEVVE
jgi:hypothetical protein